MDVIINATLPTPPLQSLPIQHYGSYDLNLLACRGYPIDAPPLGDLWRSYYGLEGQWLIVSPIYWEASHNDAMLLAANEALHWSECEAREWFLEFAAFVSAENMHLHYHNAYTWLLRVDNQPPINAKPVNALLQQSMMQALQSLDATLFWQRFLTASQMFLSQHPLNLARENEYPINGVWVWGQGALHAPSKQHVFCNDKHLVKLAQCLSLAVSEYQEGQRFSKDCILLLNASTNMTSLLDLAKKNDITRYYWNNLAYSFKAKHWLMQIFHRSKIISTRLHAIVLKLNEMINHAN